VISATAVLTNLASSRPQGQAECMVTEKRTGQQKPCQFPFTVGGTTYDSCTEVTVYTNKQDGRKWCSTKNNTANPASLNENVGKIFGVRPHTWGVCPEECLEKPSIRGTIRSTEDVDDLETNSEGLLTKSGKCPSVPRGFCAVLYDDEDCRGWRFDVPAGKHVLGERHSKDAEVVVVKRGCKITGYATEGGKVKASFCDAVGADTYCDILDNYLRDKWETVECNCG